MEVSNIGKYEVIDTLGRGSMGVVYKAKDPEIGRVVAIKTLRSIYMGDDEQGNEALQRFRQESRSAGRLHHPSIVTIFEAGRTDGGSPYIVMEYFEGESLEQLIADKAPLDALGVIHFLAQVASAIDYAHSQDVIHRDIKPSNVIIDSSHRSHLLDFGVAKLSDTSLTPAGTVVGTPSYMSPEQIRGEKLDGKTDIFALTVLTYEMLTGIRPFPGNDFTTVVSNIIHKEPISFAELEVELPAIVERVLHQGLAKTREDRFAGALEFISALAKVFDVSVDGTGLIGGYNSEMKAEIPTKDPQDSLQTMVTDSLSGANWEAAKSQISSTEEPAVNGAAPHESSKIQQAIDSSTAPELHSGSSAEVMQASGTSSSVSADQSSAKMLVKGMVGLLVVAVIGVVGGMYVLPMMKKAQTTPVVDGGLDAEIEETVEPPVVVVREEFVRVGERKFKAKKPDTPTSGFSALTVANLLDEELFYLMGAESVDPQAFKLARDEASRRDSDQMSKFLISLSEEDNFKTRVAALKALSTDAHYTKPEVFEAIILRLNDDEFLVRGFAAKILGVIEGDVAKKALEDRLAIEQHKVVKKVIQQSIAKHSR